MTPGIAYVIGFSAAAFCALCALTLINTVKHFDPPEVRSWPNQY